ncbi:MAG: phosphatase PAP2 family protein [Bryobacterales bacterium]|nr:phosphatase PAP2 family protein [Bryobacterales bacterium]
MSVGQLVLNYIEAGDHRVMNRMHSWRAPRWIRLWMLFATRGGDGWLWYSLCLLLLIFGGDGRFIAVGAAAIASSLGIALFLFLKRAFGRKRPCHIQPHCWATLLPPDRFSFPSGHTISAFAVAVPLVIVYPVLLLPLSFAAISVAMSRVVLGMHFLSDVLAGIALGGLLGFISYTVLAA